LARAGGRSARQHDASMVSKHESSEISDSASSRSGRPRSARAARWPARQLIGSEQVRGDSHRSSRSECLHLAHAGGGSAKHQDAS
jgi:hypothetical protein